MEGTLFVGWLVVNFPLTGPLATSEQKVCAELVTKMDPVVTKLDPMSKMDPQHVGTYFRKCAK